MRTRRVLSLLVAVMAMAAAACASSQNAADTGGSQLSIQFQVDNNVRNISGTTIYIVGTTGSRRQLGTIEPNRRASFDRNLRPGTYQLVGTRIGTADLLSEEFRLDTDGTIVMWNMNVNQVTFAQR